MKFILVTKFCRREFRSICVNGRAIAQQDAFRRPRPARASITRCVAYSNSFERAPAADVRRVVVSFQSSLMKSVRRIFCTVWPTNKIVSQQYNNELSRLATRDLPASLPSSARYPISFARDMRMVVRLLHIDAALWGLQHATDEAQISSPHRQSAPRRAMERATRFRSTS